MPFRSFVGYRKAELDELKAVLKERPEEPIGRQASIFYDFFYSLRLYIKRGRDKRP